MLERFLPGAEHLQNIHPLVVHFPLALLPLACAIYWLAWVARRESWAWVGLWMLALGALWAVAAAASGLYAQGGVMVAPSVRVNLLEPHRDWMLTATGLGLVCGLWALWARPMPARGRPLFMLLLVAMLLVLVHGADYGGRMVYDYNAGGQACGQPIEFTQ